MHAIQNAVLPEKHVAHLRRAGNADDHHIRSASQLRGTRGLGGALRQERFDRLAVAVRQNGHRKSLAEDVRRHGGAHQSEADEAYPRRLAHERTSFSRGDPAENCRTGVSVTRFFSSKRGAELPEIPGCPGQRI